MTTPMRYILSCLILFCAVSATAQDSVNKRVVNVTSAFKPVLKEAAKINFDATPPRTDTSRPRLQYNIPNQNLVFAYQPGSLRPLALDIDTGGRFNNWNYAKVGYGTLNTPYFEAGLSLGNGKTAGLNIYGDHISQKGKLAHQEYSKTKIELNGFVQTGNKLEWTGRFGGGEQKYNKYGYQPRNLLIIEDSLQVNFQNFSARVGMHNIDKGEFGISYSPELRVDAISDIHDNRETNTYFNLPLYKNIGEKFNAALSLEGNFTKFSPDEKTAIDNKYFSAAPSFGYRSGMVNLQLGIRPSWDNGEFKLFPNIMGEISSPDKKITFLGGWTGALHANTYQSMVAENPWIWAPHFSNNSRVEQIYGGIRGSVTDHFNYHIKLGLDKITNLPLYLNDTMTGRSFLVTQEPDLRAFNFSGGIGYTTGEKFSLRSTVKLMRYFDLDSNDKAWGLLPMQFHTQVRLQVLKDLFLRADFNAFDGVWYYSKITGANQVQGSIDLSAGLEFAITKNWKLWAQFNNLVNKEYERWNQYPVNGFHFIGGVVFAFDQGRK